MGQPTFIISVGQQPIVVNDWNCNKLNKLMLPGPSKGKSNNYHYCKYKIGQSKFPTISHPSFSAEDANEEKSLSPFLFSLELEGNVTVTQFPAPVKSRVPCQQISMLLRHLSADKICMKPIFPPT